MRLRVIASLLLVLLLRVLLPDSLILALHRHAHTTDKRLGSHFGREQVDSQHIHCETDHLFHNSLYALPETLALPVHLDHQTACRDHLPAVWKFTFPHNVCLRGPPVLPA